MSCTGSLLDSMEAISGGPCDHESRENDKITEMCYFAYHDRGTWRHSIVVRRWRKAKRTRSTPRRRPSFSMRRRRLRVHRVRCKRGGSARAVDIRTLERTPSRPGPLWFSYTLHTREGRIAWQGADYTTTIGLWLRLL